MQRLQDLADSLSRRLGRAIEITNADTQERIYSFIQGHLDTAALQRLLAPDRRAGPGVRDFVFSMIAAQEADQWPVRLPGNAELGLDSRIYAPIRYQEQVHGGLWVFDPEEDLDESLWEIIRSASETAALIFYHQRLLLDLEKSHERDLVRDLLSEGPEGRQAAASRLSEEHLFSATGPAFVFVAQPGPEAAVQDETLFQVFMAASEQFRTLLSPGRCLTLVRRDHLLFIVSSSDPTLRRSKPRSLAMQLRDTIRFTPGWREDAVLVVGIAEAPDGLPTAHQAYAAARQAVRAALTVPSLGTVIDWAELGVYRMLLQIPLEELMSTALMPGLVILLEDPAQGLLVETLETFLDCAGQAAEAADRLYIHRGTLYYRLKKIEELTQTRLDSGEDRLALHLGLKLARLSGRWAPSNPRPSAPVRQSHEHAEAELS